jgi:hypothetical protein
MGGNQGTSKHVRLGLFPMSTISNTAMNTSMSLISPTKRIEPQGQRLVQFRVCQRTTSAQLCSTARLILIDLAVYGRWTRHHTLSLSGGRRRSMSLQKPRCNERPSSLAVLFLLSMTYRLCINSCMAYTGRPVADIEHCRACLGPHYRAHDDLTVPARHPSHDKPFTQFRLILSYRLFIKAIKELNPRTRSRVAAKSNESLSLPPEALFVWHCHPHVQELSCVRLPPSSERHISRRLAG